MQTRALTATATATCLFLLLLFSYFAAMVGNEIHQTPFYYDSAIHIDAAKHYLHGIGKGINPYNFELFSTQTSGLLLVWTGALVTLLTGTYTWTSGLAAALLSLLLFASLCWQLHRLYGGQALPVFASLCGIFLLLDLQWWVFFLGENSALLLFLVSAAIAADPQLDEKKRHILFAIAATLSLRARLMALPILGGAVIYLLARQLLLIQRGQSNWKTCLALFAWSLATFAGISLLFEGLELSFFIGAEPGTYQAFLQGRGGFLAGNSTLGVGNLIRSPDILAQLFDNIIHNHAALSATLDKQIGIAVAWPVLLAACILGVTAITRPDHQPSDRFLSVILLALLLNSVWFFGLARIIFERYTLQTIFLLLFVIALSCHRLFSWPGVLALLLTTVLILPDETRTRITDSLLFREKQSDTAQFAQRYNASIRETVGFLTTRDASKPLAKCGWMAAVWSIDYLMPPGVHFSDCYQLIRKALVFDEAFYLQDKPVLATAIRAGQYASAEQAFLAGDRKTAVRYRWQHPVDFTLVIDKVTWRFAKFNALVRPAHKILMKACKPASLFENEHFLVMDCPFSALQANIPLDSFSFFVDDTPYWKR